MRNVYGRGSNAEGAWEWDQNWNLGNPAETEITIFLE